MRNADCGLIIARNAPHPTLSPRGKGQILFPCPFGERNKVRGEFPHSKGFTLIEIIITIIIVAIISSIAAVIISGGAESYSDGLLRSDIHYQAKLGVERAAREARMVRSCGDIVGPANPSATLSFTDITNTVVTFTVAGSTLQRNGVTLANNVTTAQPFRFLDSSGNPTTSCASPNDIWFVEIALSVQQGAESLDMRTRVHPRNF